MRALALALSALLMIAGEGCVVDGDDALPSCASLGCPLRPSGTPDAWTPCPDDAAECWCWGTGVVAACERE